MTSQNLTVGELAKSAGLSRSTLLYYDRLGLLSPHRRSRASYRLYCPQDVERLKQICLHREMGIPLKEIAALLEDGGKNRSVEILQHRLRVLDQEIANLRRQQRSIVQILKQDLFHKEPDMLNKDRWVEIMRAAGLDEKDMHNWHVQFEKMEPEAHQEFMESLGIPPAEIKRIREACRSV